MLIKKWPNSLHNYKKKEIDIVFKSFLTRSHGSCLEIGAGDGFEATLIKGYFKLLIATEHKKNSLEKKDRDIHYCICNAEKLPFPDDSFDFVFSSNVIEHIKKRKLCLSEIKRVLRNGGIAVHIVPSRMWKILNCLLLYPYLFALLFNRAELKRHLEQKKEAAKKSRLYILKYLFPRVHGEYRNHMEEFMYYGKGEWQRLFRDNGYKITNITKLPLASGYGFNLDGIKIFLEKVGFSSCYAFFMVRNHE